MCGRFTLSQLKQNFGLTLDESQNLFAQVSPRPVSELLTLTLQDSLTLATRVNTEKVRWPTVGRRPSPEQLEITSPVVVLSEAKKENLMGGIAQCIAEMIAAQIVNDRSNNDIPIIYGAVTSGTNWQFLTL